MTAQRILLTLAFAAAAYPRCPARDARVELGAEALANGLWEVAAGHFDTALADPSLSAADRARAIVRLAETRVRAQQPAGALELLDVSLVAAVPEAAFWRAQAVAGTGRFGEAVELLGTLLENPDAPHRAEAAYTRANLQLATGKPDDALATLDTFAAGADPEAARQARLRAVAILLDLGRTAEARERMPGPTDDAAPDSYAILLEARLLAAEGEYRAAASLYQSLLDQTAGQSLRHHHLAALGKAETRAALGDPAGAIQELLSFITVTKEKDWPLPLMPAMFERIVAWTPEQPAPNDPLFARLAEWIPQFIPPSTGLIACYGHGVEGAWPTEPKGGELAAYSMYATAVAKSRTGVATDTAEARLLYERVRHEFPGHPLAARAMYREAAMDLENGAPALAARKLDALQVFTNSPDLRGHAAFLQGVEAFRRGDHEAAALLFSDAAAELAPPLADSALFDAAIAGYENDGVAMIPITADAAAVPGLAADLALERALTLDDPDARRAALEAFIGSHPDHPRLAEARLAAAEAALAGGKPDASFARAQLDTIAENPETEQALPAGRMDWVKLRIADLAGKHEEVVAIAGALLEREPAPAEAPEIAFILGRNLFESGRYNDARMVVERLAASDDDPARAQAAWLLAAGSAALVGTPQSRQDALVLYDKAIDAGGPVSPIARLEKARLMIDMNRLPEAIGFLRDWFGALGSDDPLHLPAGMLLGEAIYARGGTDGDSLGEALAVYDQLLRHAEKQPSLYPRIQYLRGQVLEQLPDPADSSKKRERDAFIAYYSVLETETPPAEWHSFELCGFKALSLLEKAGRWPAAIACARRIASFGGPRAEEAAKRADDLQLKHMIWED